MLKIHYPVAQIARNILIILKIVVLQLGIVKGRKTATDKSVKGLFICRRQLTFTRVPFNFFTAEHLPVLVRMGLPRPGVQISCPD